MSIYWFPPARALHALAMVSAFLLAAPQSRAQDDLPISEADAEEECPEQAMEEPQTGPFFHSGPIVAAAFSPDGKILATGATRGGEVCLWDPATGRKLHELVGHGGGTTRVEFSPDGRLLASAGWDGEVYLWDPATGKQVRRLPRVNLGVTGLAFSPDSKVLATATLATRQIGYRVRWYNLATGKFLREGTSPHDGRFGEAAHIAYDRDGKEVFVLISGRRGGLVTLNAGTGTKLRDIASASGYHAVFALAPSGLTLALDSDASGNVSLLSSETGEAVRSWPAIKHGIKHDLFQPQRLAISPNGQLIALADGATFSVCEIASGKERFRSAKAKDYTCCVAFSPDGRSVFAGSMDGTGMVHDLYGGMEAPRELTAAKLAILWQNLGSDDGFKAHRAIGTLARMPDSISFLRDRLLPNREKELQINRLIGDLESNRFPVRQRAAEELERIGLPAEGPIRKARLNRPSLDLSRRLAYLLNRLEKNVPPGLRVRRRRALEVIGHIGTPEARRVIDDLALWDRAEMEAAFGRRGR